MREIKEIVFDLDGTLADLYNVDNWLPKIRNENTEPYEIANPLWDMVELVTILRNLQMQGINIRVVSWLSKDSTENYKQKVRKAKIDWMNKYDLPRDNCNLVAYGTKKQNCIRNKNCQEYEYILIDDSQEVRDSWTVGRTIDPTDTNILEFLKGLLAE